MKTTISALIDGELSKRELRSSIRELEQDQALREAWDMYHLIGDGLRRTEPLSNDFVEKVRNRLDQEPMINISWYSSPKGWVISGTAALLLIMGIVVLSNLSLINTKLEPIIALGVFPQTVQNETYPVPVNMNDYLMAHQGFSFRSSIQGVAPYVRTISEVETRHRQ